MLSKDFEKSRISVIEGSSRTTTYILYLICIENYKKGIVFIDGSNLFNPYVLNRLTEIRGINSILSNIYISRAFTEFQFENLIESLPKTIIDKKSGIVLISDLTMLFNSIESKNFYYDKFDKILDNIRLLTKESELITVIAMSGNTYYDTLIKNKADKIIKLSGDDMGRTVPSFRYHLEDIISELSVFRRALHGEDKIAFDNLMQKARKHASSCTIVPTIDPLSCILLSILIEQQKEIECLKNDKNENG